MENDDLLLEFRNAANSVTKLFKLARDSVSDGEEAKKIGYQTALQDIIALLSTNPDFDIQGWAMHILLDMKERGEKGRNEEKGKNDQIVDQLLVMDGQEGEEHENYDSGAKRRNNFLEEMEEKRMRY